MRLFSGEYRAKLEEGYCGKGQDEKVSHTMHSRLR
jgi:hypothetical protein